MSDERLSGNGFPIQQEIDMLWAQVCEIADTARGSDREPSEEVEAMLDSFLLALTQAFALPDESADHQATAD
jgi:hypothetical protein